MRILSTSRSTAKASWTSYLQTITAIPSQLLNCSKKYVMKWTLRPTRMVSMKWKNSNLKLDRWSHQSKRRIYLGQACSTLSLCWYRILSYAARMIRSRCSMRMYRHHARWNKRIHAILPSSKRSNRHARTRIISTIRRPTTVRTCRQLGSRISAVSPTTFAIKMNFYSRKATTSVNSLVEG